MYVNSKKGPQLSL